MSHRAFVLVAAMMFASLCPRAAGAQAWVPSKGEGSVSVLFQDLFVENHFFDRGQRVDRGEIRTNTLMADVTYGLTDRLAVTLAVPFIRTQYSGRFPHPTAQDDGTPNYGFQDLRFSVRYNVADGPLAITPFVGTNMPTHGYEYFAHAAYGVRVRELEVGTYVGRVLSPALPNAFVQARYSYSFAEEIVGVDHDRSNLDIEFGYFLTSRLRVFTLGAGQKTHGGIGIPDAGFRALPAEQMRHHDRIGRIDLLNVAGGVQYSLTRSIDVFGSFTKSLAGRNTHALDRGITIGATWSFGGGLRGFLETEETEASLIKCLCQK